MKQMHMRLSWLFLIMAFARPVLAVPEMSKEQLEQWFNEDESEAPLQVEQGELTFLEQLPQKPVPHSISHITISNNSINTGWVSLSQCYRNLDPVPRAEIVFRYRFMRKLAISSARNIDQAWVEGQSIELENLQQDAELCIKAEVRVLYQNPDGSFSLVNGPYFRKFLDGFFPYHLTLSIDYPASLLKLQQTQPVAQPGFDVKKTHRKDTDRGRIEIDTVFAGELSLEIFFRLLARPS